MRALTLFCLWLLAGWVSAAPVLVQTASGNVGASTTCTATFASNPTAGDMIVVAIGSNSTTSNVTGVSNTSDTFALVNSQVVGITSEGWCYYAKAIAGGASTKTVTVTFDTSAAQVVIVREYSGVTSTPLDGHVINNPTGTTAPSSGNATTTQLGDLLVGYCVTSTQTATITAGSGYGNVVTASSGTALEVAMEDQVAGAAGSYAATFSSSTSASFVVGIATFLTGGGGGTGGVPELPLLGVGMFWRRP